MALGNIGAEVRTNTLVSWEAIFREVLQRVDIVERQKAGALLSVIPNHIEWDTNPVNITVSCSFHENLQLETRPLWYKMLSEK